MATIKSRKQANGETRHTAIVGIRKGKVVVHCESKTFTHRTAAASWAKHREVALENPDELRRAREQKQSGVETYLLKHSSAGTSKPSSPSRIGSGPSRPHSSSSSATRLERATRGI